MSVVTRRQLLLSLPALAIPPSLGNIAREPRRGRPEGNPQAGAPPIRVRTLSHFGLAVSDTKRSVDFYQGLFGMPIQARAGDNTMLRERLNDVEREYVLAVGPASKVFAPETVFAVPARTAATGRPKSRPRPDREPEAIGELIARVADELAQTLCFRDGPDGKPVTSRFVFVRVRAAHDREKATPWPPREEWLIGDWPAGKDEPTDYWISNLPADTEPEQLARLARLRWKIELDYKQLKGELGLDHYEGRSWIGWHHHTALVTVAHGFLTLERLCPRAPRLA